MPEVMLCNECLFLAAKSLLEGDDDGAEAIKTFATSASNAANQRQRLRR
jgi:hypothetical protein